MLSPSRRMAQHDGEFPVATGKSPFEQRVNDNALWNSAVKAELTCNMFSPICLSRFDDRMLGETSRRSSNTSS